MSELTNKLSLMVTIIPTSWFVVFFLIIMLFVQTGHAIARPKEKDRARLIMLILFFMLFNLAKDYLPNRDIIINYKLQVFIAYSFLLLMAYYLTYYMYKLLQTKRFYALFRITPVYLLLVPYIVGFLFSQFSNKEIFLTSQPLAILPALYTIIAIITLIIIAKKESLNYGKKVNYFNLKIISCIAGTITFLGFAATRFFDNDTIEVLAINSGFIVMLFISFYIYFVDYRETYTAKREFKDTLQELRKTLKQKVIQRTWEIEIEKEKAANNYLNLAHEVSTPLMLLNDYLEEYILNRRKNKEIDIIKENVEKLNRKVKKFLNAEDFQKGKSVLDNTQITNFSKTLNDALVLFQRRATERKITLVDNVKDNVFVEASADAIETIINNLLDNAIKYSPDKEFIKINLTTRIGKVFFTVKDNGMGIPQDKQIEIFKPRVQLQTRQGRKKGIGMGLSLVYVLVNKLKGNIRLSSKEHAGSEFIVELNEYKIRNEDKAKTDKENIPQKAKINSEKLLDSFTDKKFTLLIVDDDLTMLVYLRNKFLHDYNVILAKNGIEALLKLERISKLPDIIISDVMMDKMNGFELLETLSDNPKFNYIPFVFLTAKTTVNNKIKGLQLGAVDYICKPFQVKVLKVKIESILKIAVRQRKTFITDIYETASNRTRKQAGNSEINLNTFKNNCNEFGITTKELEIIELMSQGLTYKIIADKLFISLRTAETHRSNIFKKVGVTNRKDLLKKLLY